jgi:nucleotide-binding universal stress UspA family protein
MDAIQKILVPTDFSAHADEVFRVVHTLAKSIGAEVILFHVAQSPAVVSEAGRLLTDPGTGNTANLWERFQNILPNDSRVGVEHPRRPVMVVKAPAHQVAPPLVHVPNSPGTTKAEDGHAG